MRFQSPDETRIFESLPTYKWRFTTQEKISNDSYRPNVTFFIVGAFHYFGGNCVGFLNGNDEERSKSENQEQRIQCDSPTKHTFSYGYPQPRGELHRTGNACLIRNQSFSIRNRGSLSQKESFPISNLDAQCLCSSQGRQLW